MLKRRRAAGFGLLEIIAVLALAGFAAVWAAAEAAARAERAAAESAGRYMLAVRGAVHRALAEHWSVLHGLTPTAGDPVPPAWASGSFPMDLSIADLQVPPAPGAEPYLSPSFPTLPAYGGEMRVRIDRTGTCPPDPASGSSCQVHAVVYTAEPVSASSAYPFSPDIIATMIEAADGYGGHSSAQTPGRLRGAIFDLPNPLGDRPGVVGVVASLDTTPWHQFVRQGDSRHIYLANALSVTGPITTTTGLMLDTAVVPGQSCGEPGLYATTARRSLATCADGTWFELTGHVVTGLASNLAAGAPMPTPSCPPGTTPFVHLAQQRISVRIDPSVGGAGTVTLPGGTADARAMAISGCRYS